MLSTKISYTAVVEQFCYILETFQRFVTISAKHQKLRHIWGKNKLCSVIFLNYDKNKIKTLILVICIQSFGWAKYFLNYYWLKNKTADFSFSAKFFWFFNKNKIVIFGFFWNNLIKTVWGDRGWVPKFATGLIYQIRHNSKIKKVTKLSFGQNNPPTRAS